MWNDKAEKQAMQFGIGSPVQLTITDRLEMRKKDLENQLARVNAALDALKASPDVERVMNLLQQASY